MSTNSNDSGIPSREQFGLPRLDDVRQSQETPPLVVPPTALNQNGQLEWIMSTIAKLESRLDANERRNSDHRVPPRPDPDPPYGASLPTAVRENQLHRQPLPPQSGHNNPPAMDVLGNPRPMPQIFPPIQPDPHYYMPPFTVPDPYAHLRPHQGYVHQGQYTSQHYGPVSPFDRQSSSSLPGPRPTSCWYPSPTRPSHGHQSQEQPRGVRMDPPRFDGSDTANWIFKIQYYFDHMMMPDANRLHYVVPLFDPPAAEWIKHFCSNNDHVTWQDFLNEVRYRFDPDCYESYIGLIAKLCQTGTVSEYQLEFERLQNKLSGVPDYILLPIYVAGLKQP